jgi:hypothetical protein
MTDPVPSKERVGFLIDYWSAKSRSHESWPEGQGLQAELVGLIYADTIAALKHLQKPVHEREGPHCSTCGCGLAPEPQAEAALRNCLLLAMRVLSVKHPDSLGAKNWEHIVRFCKEGGVEPSPLRTAQPPRDGQ